MDQSYTDSDISLSPTQILERLQLLRQLQELQRGKLQNQRLDYEDGPEESTTEVISHFTSSTSYNTFRSMLHYSNEEQRLNSSNAPSQVRQQDLIEGVSVLNLSQESEFIISSPISSNSRDKVTLFQSDNKISPKTTSEQLSGAKKKIDLDEMPILTPKKDFESLILEKIQCEKTKSKPRENLRSKNTNLVVQKKPFLKRGEGMTRFRLKKNDLVIQDTNSLPWKRRNNRNINDSIQSNKKSTKQSVKPKNKNDAKIKVQFVMPETKTKEKSLKHAELKIPYSDSNEQSNSNTKPKLSITNEKGFTQSLSNESCQLHNENNVSIAKPQKSISKHPLLTNKGKTWAAILSKEQDDFLRQLKHTEYYRNFASPAKSTMSDASCDENLCKLRQDRETAEQNMFELLENKVSHESFNLDSSFFNKFLKTSKLECSGESTPLIFKKCLANNPELLHIFPPPEKNTMCNGTQSDIECDSECTECDVETCSSASMCCSCKTMEESNHAIEIENRDSKIADNKKPSKLSKRQAEKLKEKENNELDDTVIQKDDLKADMAEMNSKLVATSELLKERLSELEDEIETFRKENIVLTKLREEIDLERKKFYEEKSAFEQKYNEEKVLSEYYLAEEKEKLTKQKQMYERYVREMRGRLNKREKDEVLNLKQEINDLKEEIRVKDAKSTSSIARLRNHIKIIEKEKKEVQDECEKLKKVNRRIQHTNETTRRLSNIKYLEEINRKLSTIATRESKSEISLDNDIKYRDYEIERRSRNSKRLAGKNNLRQRAKSVPNLNVTSRYAKYFSQRDVISQMERNGVLNIERLETCSPVSDDYRVDLNYHKQENLTKLNLNDSDSSIRNATDSEEENKLEKIYSETFKTVSPINSVKHTSPDYSLPSTSRSGLNDKTDSSFFIRKSALNSNASVNISSRSISPYLHNHSHETSRSKSPVSILSNRSASNHISPTVVEVHRQKEDSNLDTTTYRMNVLKTNLNPTEIKQSDGARELRFSNGNVKYLSADGKYSKFTYYNGDVKETFFGEGRIKYFYAETKTYHTTHPDGLEVLEFPDGQIEKRYKDGSTEIRLPNGSVRYSDPKNEHVREEWRFPDGTVLTVAASGEQVVRFTNGQVEVHAKDHKRREFPDGTVKLVYSDGTSETRYSSGRIRVRDKQGNLIMDSAPG